jgi:ABC-type glycerol-3-phosphate transport system substrate-binding protein
MATGDIPYLFLWGTSGLGILIQRGITEDMSAIIKKTNFDLARFNPQLLNDIRILSGNNELVGIPVSSGISGLYYNKDIFDKFEKSYPTPGKVGARMNWDVVEFPSWSDEPNIVVPASNNEIHVGLCGRQNRCRICLPRLTTCIA